MEEPTGWIETYRAEFERRYRRLDAGLVDIPNIRLSPLVLGGGTRLFPAHEAKRRRPEQTGIVSTPAAHHLSHRVLG